MNKNKKSNELKKIKLNNKEKENLLKQEIIFSKSKLFNFIELISSILHILAIIFGVISLSGVFFLASFNLLNETLEIITIIIISLILLIHFTRGPIRRKIIKNMLHYFWGKNKLETLVHSPEKIDKWGFAFGELKKQKTTFHEIDVEIKWIRAGKFKNKKILEVSIDVPISRLFKRKSSIKGDYKFVSICFYPRYIMVNSLEKYLKFHSKVWTDLKYKYVNNKEFLFNFNIKDSIATWSGIFPEQPFYGEWVWNTNVRTDKNISIQKIIDKVKKEKID